jgi:serine phosphatase RsbU (regulator of sigma subunit)
MIDLVNTYKNQACLSIGNKRLLDKAVDQAIYAKEIEIAKKVKSVLIPQNIPQFDEIDLAYYSSSADDVGGDYFDISKRNGHINIVLADISGKGTAASFNMAEFKGVFQSLNMFELTLNNFICLANDILYKTLEKNSFITAIFLRVDTKGRTIKVARAGHCPLLLYRKKDHEVFVIQQSGLGLAITEGKKFADMLAEVEFEFSEGDLIFSYTDGLTDQKRNEIDFFDTSFLKEFIKQHAHLPVSEFRAILAKLLIDTKVYNTVTDDMSFIVGKLK